MRGLHERRRLQHRRRVRLQGDVVDVAGRRSADDQRRRRRRSQPVRSEKEEEKAEAIGDRIAQRNPKI